MKKFVDPSLHSDWLNPHSLEWYQQLGVLNGKYLYPWNSILEKPNGESIFDNEALRMVQDKKVLDIGCGHGDFSLICSTVARKVIGFDSTEQFIGNAKQKNNVDFVVGSTKEGLPFGRDEFDCAYIRKGPTSSYPLLSKVVKSGGEILGLHPGDESGKELPHLFPNMFKQPKVKVMDILQERIENSNFSKTGIQTVNSVEFLQSPIDVIKLCCFGQKETVFQMVVDHCMDQITETFNRHASNEGLAITYSRYIVRLVM